LVFIAFALVAIHSGHIMIGHGKFSSGHTIVYLSQQPRLFWIYVTLALVGGVIFIFQGIRNRGE
jgi:hypothetical protein